MNTISRRHFLKLTGAAAALAATPMYLKAQNVSGRVVVVGGGFAGATLAKYLKLWGGAGVAVTLVDANPAHVSCILSNLVLTNSLNLSQITFNYAALQQLGVNFVQGRATGLEKPTNGTWRVQVAGRTPLDCEHVVLAPGIEFQPVAGWDPNKIPHAWQAGAQTTLLKQQIQTMRAGGLFIMTVPPKPYRCPPGPYERACVVADYLKRTKPGSKVIVLDANPGIVAEPETFTKAFTQTHAGVIQYLPNAALLAVDSNQRIANTSIGDFKADVLNVIAPQKAGALVTGAGLTGAGLWAPVNPLNYESTLAGMAGVHIIGDSQGTGQPKSGHIANAEAKVCADAILRAFAGEAPDPIPVTNSACYSPITANTASWLTAVYAYNPATKTMDLVPASFGEAAAPNRDNYEDMFDWSANLFADTFA